MEKFLFDTVDTEERQLQAISDLYAVLKAQPKYKDLKDPKWKEGTPPLEVLKWILRKLGPLAEGQHWTVDTYRAGNKIRFRFVVFQHFYAFDLKPKEIYIPLDFLPALKKRDLPLHDLIIDVFALVSKYNRIPLWDEDGDYSEQLKVLRREKLPTGNEVLDRQVTSYKSGPAAEYLALLKKRRQVVTVPRVREKVNAYQDTSQRKGDIKSWLRSGVYLASLKQTLEPWTFVPNHLPGNPVGPFRQYKVVWSVHENDVIYRRATDRLQKDSENGDFYPLMFSAARPGEKLGPLKEGQFPKTFWWFMEHGWKILFTRYKQYFYKTAFDETETPAERLLVRIEAMELRATV